MTKARELSELGSYLNVSGGVASVNNITVSSNLEINVVVANGSVGTAGQMLTSNGSGVYWLSPQIGDITNVIAGTGLTGGGSSGEVTVSLATSGVVANTYGNSSSIPVITVDTYGRLTNVSTTAAAVVTNFTYTGANNTFSISTGDGSTFTANITAANATLAGVVTVLDSVTNTSVLIAASANSVKNAYDRAIDANTRAASAQTAAISAYSNATSYADSAAATAYSNAVSVASADATNKAANAYSNAVSYAATIAGTAYSNAVSTAAADATSKANNAYTTAVAAAASDATSKANNAYTTAVAAAASDATNKAANAYSNAVSYAATIAGTAYSNAVSTAAADATSKANNAYTTAVSAASTDATNKAANAYSNATTFASNASNISSGTLAEARLPFRMNQNVRTTDTVQFGNMTVTGNLTVSGTTVTVSANNLVLQDNMIYLNDGNTVANPDLGIAGNYNDGTYRHAGFFRDATDGVWKVYDQYLPEPDASPYIDTSNASFRVADFQANVVTMASANVGGATINSTSYTGSANNATYLNGIDSSRVLYGNNASGSTLASGTQDVYELAQRKSGFWDANPGAAWTPDSAAYWWGATFAHVSNGPSYNYSGQLAFKNSLGGNQIYARTISNGSPSSWSHILSSGNYTSYAMPIGSLATNTVGIGAPVYYDSADSGYFLDLKDQFNNTYTKSLGGFYVDATGHYFRSTASVLWAEINSDYLIHTSDIRSPLFYDSDNTFYYLDPASTSYLRNTYVDRYFQRATGTPTNNLGDPTVTEMALFDQQFTNKTEFFPPANVIFETSTDGTTWTTFSVSDAQKKIFVGGDDYSSISIPYNTPYFRVRFVNDGNYVFLNALYTYWASQGHTTKVQIYTKDFGSSTWVQYTNSNEQVSSWPGHLYLPFQTIAYHPGTYVDQVAVVFQPTWNPTWSANGIALYKMQIWGGYPAGKRTIYAVNADREVTFPAAVKAPSFYDSNDTTYYVDPASTSNMSQASFRDYIRITNSGGAQHLLMGNQDSGGTNSPAILTSANRYFEFGYGNTWTGDGGTKTYYSYMGSDFARHNASYRAPIFYDTDNTAYFLDAASGSTSLFTAGLLRTYGWVQAGYLTGGVAMTTNDGYGNANITWNHIGGTPEQNGNSARITVNTDSTSGAYMDLQVKSNVTSGVAVGLTSALTAYETYTEIKNSTRSPIYYDSNNTAYWVDPASNSVLTSFNLGGGETYVYSGSTNALNIRTGAGGSYKYFGFESGGRFVVSNGGIFVGGYLDIQYNSGNEFAGMGIRNNYGSASLTASNFIDFNNENGIPKASLFGIMATNGAGYLQFFSTAPGVSRSTDSRTTTGFAYYNQWQFITSAGITTNILYDSDNTGYYLDPNSTTNLQNLSIQGSVFSTIDSPWYYDAAIEIRERNLGGSQTDSFNNAPRLGFHWGGRVAMQLALDSSAVLNAMNGDCSGYTAMRMSDLYANVLYDRNNTAYYTDPASTSVFNALTVGGSPVMRGVGQAGATGVNWNTLGNNQNTIYEITQETFNIGSGSGNSNFPTTASYAYGTLINFGAWGNARAQMYISHAGNDLIFRGGWTDSSWQTWNKVLTDQNYNSYAPTLTGTGASGTWGISISGTAATATALASTTNFFVNRGDFGAAAVDTVTGLGVWNQNNVGDSHTLLVFGAGGSTSTVQQRFHYTGSMEFRNRTDSANWTAWKTVLTSANYNSYSPTLTGTGASGTWGISITGNAATASSAVTLSTNRTNWLANGVLSAVVGQLAWRNYGSNHTIFDASASLTPSGTSCNNTNPDVGWAGTYPTLMGWNGTSTYGVRVDSARLADGPSGSTFTASGDFRAPIFYDSNDTNYFLDPANNVDAAAKFAGGIHVSIGNTSGRGIILADDGDIVDMNDGYCSMRFSLGVRVRTGNRTGDPMYELNSVYGSSNLENSRGLVINGNYTDGRYSTRLRKWDDGGGVPLYVQQTIGTAGSWANVASFGSSNNRYSFHVDGIAYAGTDIRAPLYYDANDTNFYMNPNGFSRVQTFGVVGQREYPGSINSDWEGGYYHFGPGNDTPTGSYGHAHIIRLSADWNVQMFFPTSNTNEPFWLRRKQSGTYSAWRRMLQEDEWISNKYFGSDGAIYGTIFYDTNNTGYYLNPNGLTFVDSLITAGNITARGDLIVGEAGVDGASYIYMQDADEGQRIIHCNSNRIGFLTQGGAWGSWCDDDGSMMTDHYMRSPIYYDHNDTGKYLDPNGSSILVGTTVVTRNANSNDTFGGLEMRENALQGAATGAATEAPGINFHWSFRAASRIYMDAGGNFVLGAQNDITNGRRNLSVNELTAAGNITAYSSDKRLKTNVAPIQNALDKVMSIGGYTFDWIDGVEKLGFTPDHKTNDAGVLAQEIEAVLPQAVAPAPFDQQWNVEQEKYASKSGEDYLTVRYERIVPLLIEAIKELKAEIEELKANK